MNRVELIGRLTSKPELKYTNSNIAVSKFSIAVNGYNDKTDFINIVAWKNQAENLCKFQDKGSLVSVEGRIQTGSYDDKDGKKVYTVEVVADNIGYLESKKNGQTPIEEVNPSDFENKSNSEIVADVMNDPFADFGDSVSVDDNFLE